MDFVAIDFETANARKSSICQAAVVVVQDSQIVVRKSWFIKPKPFYFDPENTSIHGIDKWMVQDSPDFEEVWDEIKLYLEGSDVLIYNANFDMGLLRATLQTYDLEPPLFHYACALQMARVAWPGEKSYKLTEIARRCQVVYTPHQAEEDAFACAAVALAAAKVVFPRYEPFVNRYEEVVNKFMLQNPRISDIVKDASNHQSLHPLYGKNIVFTGDLQTMSRAEAWQRVSDIGGIVKSAVSSKTHYLVTGIQDTVNWVSGFQSSKLRKARELNENGQAIELINETQFLALIGKAGSTEATNKKAS